ncbi:uncharacterized protein LOC132705723 [Cylas formicarius]|uniref:uncharacterized protein LOC132705723 n=1 Tax=Cylas formicarius TaxID=197179 RepID=UPI00295878F0|nr:uncharacterized protein LOC132705723 [Cylas formicarius]
MSVATNNQLVVRELIDKIFANRNIGNFDVTYSGNSENGDGYLGDIIFAQVTPKNGKTRTHHLVLKFGKRGEDLRKKFPVRLAFEREIHMYGNVFPAFQQFLKEKNLEPFDFLPECFGTFISEDYEAIALQNLKAISYDIRGRTFPLDAAHIKLTMEAYGKWHATSLALAEQNPKLFGELSNIQSLWPILGETESFKVLFGQAEEDVTKILTDNNEFDLLRKFKQKFHGKIYDTWREVVVQELEPRVITHGDCWSNNFMFKYENEEKKNPAGVKLIDFQISQLASPMMDLSYHLFTVCSEETLKSIKSIFDIYYDSLSEHLRKLGSDPLKIFPRSTLIDHWSKYWPFGVIMTFITMPLIHTESSDVVAIENMNEEQAKNLKTKLQGESKRQSENRIINAIKSGLQFQF